MNTETALASVVGLLALWTFLVYFWPYFRVDSFRDEVFSLRDKLFLYAAGGSIDFTNPAYAILRERMNIIIRYAHEFTLTRLFIALRTQNTTDKDEAIVRWEESVAALPKPIQEKMNEFNRSLVFAVVKHMAFNSFFLYLVTRPLWEVFKRVRIDVRSEVVNRPHVVWTVERLESDALGQDARRHARAEATASA